MESVSSLATFTFGRTTIPESAKSPVVELATVFANAVLADILAEQFLYD
jgi:hypothetical protein